MNPYLILGVSSKSSKLEIRRAFLEKAKATHPDNGGLEEDFILVKKAYDILVNEKKIEPSLTSKIISDNREVITQKVAKPEFSYNTFTSYKPDGKKIPTVVFISLITVPILAVLVHLSLFIYHNWRVVMGFITNPWVYICLLLIMVILAIIREYSL